MKFRILTCITPMILLIAGVIAFSPDAQAQSFRTVYSFTGASDGGTPQSGLIRDTTGNLYGTTLLGGLGFGTVYKISNRGKETVLHSFSGTGGDGTYPQNAALIRDAKGNLYGTTIYGGDTTCNPPYGCGVVFKLNTTGHEIVLHTFTGTDGAIPNAGLTRDANGNLYGTTYQGGDLTCPGSNGLGCGTVFKLDSHGNETVLHSFLFGSDGAYPRARVILDSAGNLYGTTQGGGTFCGGVGCGTVFELTPPPSGWTEKVLYSFCQQSLCADGEVPNAVIRDANGNLYGTTTDGGSTLNGTVFKVDINGNETVLHNFTGGTDGGIPQFGGLVRDASGNLYGDAVGGGDPSCRCGVVFKLDTGLNETVLHSFVGTDGKTPLGTLLQVSGVFYGITMQGGKYGAGTVYKLTP